MFTTIVAILCHALNGVPVCAEEIVTDTALSGVTFQQCLIGGELGISQWMADSPLYRSWQLKSWKCVPGHYVIPGRA